ncbi:MAG: hypothetical protein EXS08_11365 [Planctomycetes bacterium]|nr:hypothetical protein [Planctomycetota bacterium]
MTSPTSRLCALLLCAWLAPASPAQEHEQASEQGESPTRRTAMIAVSRQETKDGPRWSVLCEDVPFDELVRALAKKSALALESVELLPYGTRISVDLSRRPLEQILEFVLGSQGLRFELQRGSLRVLAPLDAPEDLLRLAQSAWQQVEAGGDEHAAARAKLARGNLCEVRGDLEGAYHLYAELAEEDAGHESAEALYRAGRALERLGHWAEAAQHFRTLAALDGAGTFHARARLELARVSIKLGDAPSALHLLNFLDANFLSSDPVELAERRLVRATALIVTNECVEALRTLEEGEVVSAPNAQARSLEIRAQAFEGLGFDVEAARAWLIFAREGAATDERVRAFAKAAELSLAAGDELGTLFVCREAAKAGADEGLGSFARQARLRLGLDEDDVPGTIQERVALAESLLAEQPRKAAELFEGLYLARGALPEPDQARVLAGWAHVLLDRAGLKAAIELLAKARANFEDPLAAQALDLAAAALFESEGRFDQAAEAYRGNY